MGLRCTIYFVLLAVSILAVNPGFGATQLDELFRYAGKMPAFQKIINDTASCQTWLTNQSSALWAFTQDAVAFRLQKIWNKGQSLNIRGLVWR
ncbi:MAG: hypothetical protein J6Y94_09025, partial [Bacteriovoracaceae bacterium]|nr:hypothetical protein [Bacteriovoracaceae bacterium]